MPKDTSIKKVLVIGSGPIIIGQAAEFDYAGTQACRALREEGLEVVLVNSNPATIMTDKAMADKVYIEPMTVEAVQEIIKKERPDSLLPKPRRPDRPEPRHGAVRERLPGQMGVKLALREVPDQPLAQSRRDPPRCSRTRWEKIGEPCIASKGRAHGRGRGRVHP